MTKVHARYAYCEGEEYLIPQPLLVSGLDMAATAASSAARRIPITS